MHFTGKSLDGDKDEITRATHHCLLSVLHLFPFPHTEHYCFSRGPCRKRCPGPEDPAALTAGASASPVPEPALFLIGGICHVKPLTGLY